MGCLLLSVGVCGFKLFACLLDYVFGWLVLDGACLLGFCARLVCLVLGIVVVVVPITCWFCLLITCFLLLAIWLLLWV